MYNSNSYFLKNGHSCESYSPYHGMIVTKSRFIEGQIKLELTLFFGTYGKDFFSKLPCLGSNCRPLDTNLRIQAQEIKNFICSVAEEVIPANYFKLKFSETISKDFSKLECVAADNSKLTFTKRTSEEDQIHGFPEYVD